MSILELPVRPYRECNFEITCPISSYFLGKRYGYDVSYELFDQSRDDPNACVKQINQLRQEQYHGV